MGSGSVGQDRGWGGGGSTVGEGGHALACHIEALGIPHPVGIPNIDVSGKSEAYDKICPKLNRHGWFLLWNPCVSAVVDDGRRVGYSSTPKRLSMRSISTA